MRLRKRLIWASQSVAKGINPCWVWHKLRNPSNMIHTLNSSPRWAAGTGWKEKCSPSNDSLPWKIYGFPLKLSNLWMWQDFCGMGKQSIHSSVISQLQAGNPHLHVPRKLALDDHSVGKSKQKWASKFQETQTWSSMRSLAKKPTISEAVKPCICVNPGFPHFLVVSDLCLACLHSLSEQIWQHSSWEGLSRSTISVLCSSTYLKSRANVQNNTFR